MYVLELLSQSSSSIPFKSPGSKYQLFPEPSIVLPSPSASSPKFCHKLFLKSGWFQLTPKSTDAKITSLLPGVKPLSIHKSHTRLD